MGGAEVTGLCFTHGRVQQQGCGQGQPGLMSFSLAGRGGGQGGGGEWGGNQHSNTAEEKEVSEIFPGRQGSSELWLPSRHNSFVSLAGFQILSLDLCLNMTQ